MQTFESVNLTDRQTYVSSSFFIILTITMKIYECTTICSLDNLCSAVVEATVEVKVAIGNIDKLARRRRAAS